MDSAFNTRRKAKTGDPFRCKLGSFATTGSASSETITVGAGLHAYQGDLVVLVAHGNATATAAITDSKGNTWTVDENNNGTATSYGPLRATCIIPDKAHEIGAGDTIIVTWSAAQTRRVGAAAVFTNVTIGQDKHNATANTAASATISTAATSQAKELVIGVCALSLPAFATPPGAVATIDTSFHLLDDLAATTTAGGREVCWGYKLVNAAAAQSATFTFATTYAATYAFYISIGTYFVNPPIVATGGGGGPADATITTNRTTSLAVTHTEMHALHAQNSIRGKNSTGSADHNPRALAAAITACNGVFKGHASHITGPAGSGWQQIECAPGGAITTAAQTPGTTVSFLDATTGLTATPQSARCYVPGDDLGVAVSWTGVDTTNKRLTGATGFPGSMPTGTIIIQYQFNGGGTTDRPLISDTSSAYSTKELFDQMTGTTRTLILQGASQWLRPGNGTSTSWNFPPDWAHLRAFALVGAECVRQFAVANGNHAYITDVSLWNEFKGYTAHDNYGTTGSGPGGILIPGDAQPSNYYNFPGFHYISMFNTLWSVFKNHPDTNVAGCNVHLPHFGLGGTANNTNHSFPFGSANGSVAAWAYDFNFFKYLIDYSTDFDGLTLDWSIVEYTSDANATETYIYANADNFVDIIKVTYDTLATRAGLSTHKRARISDGRFTNLQQACYEAMLVMRGMVNGVYRLYRWQPMGGDDNGASPNAIFYNAESYFLTTQRGDTSGAPIAGMDAGDPAPPLKPGDITPAYTNVKALMDMAPAGTQLYNVTSSDSLIEVICTSTKVAVLNKYASDKSVSVNGGATVTCPARRVTVITA
jgi:hypothetical protein